VIAVFRLPSLTLLAVLSLGACRLETGNGQVTTETRTVGAFKKLEVDSALTVVASLGTPAVQVTTDQNLQQYVEAVVTGETLVLRVTPGVNLGGASRLEARVVNDVLEGVVGSGAVHVAATASPVASFTAVASGASTVTVSGVDATSLTAEASGASALTVSGAATAGTLTSSGASTLDTRGVPLTSAGVTVSGASTLRAAVGASLSGAVSGASVGLITGHPAQTVSLTGASTLSLDQP
jgi:hypothetical protein